MHHSCVNNLLTARNSAMTGSDGNGIGHTCFSSEFLRFNSKCLEYNGRSLNR